MEHPHSFQIYDASAGSGKTYTLVKEYLKRLLVSKKEGYYKHILAITFTNKAVAEMKHRIVTSLEDFLKEDTLVKPPEMMASIARETGLKYEEIQRRSGSILKHLLHHYAMFSVETIDHFNHRLLRTFARDLKLPAHFEVSLDTPLLLSEAVDALIERSGSDAEITKTLLEFALEKADDDASWDISRDIANTARLLLSETDSIHIARISEKSLRDFGALKSEMIKRRQEAISTIATTAQNMLTLIAENGLNESDFSGGYLPKYFEKLASENFKVTFGAKWQASLEDKPLYPTRVDTETAAVIDRLAPQLVEGFLNTKDKIHGLQFIDAVLKNIVPLSVINLVGQELEIIKEEQNVLPISQFNALIYNELKDQPTPYIYERLGERYRHFFIDEFQDTSLLQWNNLIPLIDNALSQEYSDGTFGSLLLVGDAKQAIYRWRGGLPEQFMGLSGEGNPFQVGKNITHLDTNFRSHREIIAFNNAFFSFVSNHFGNTDHSQLYSTGSDQAPTSKEGGYVKLEFVDFNTRDEGDICYSEHVVHTIRELKAGGFSESDICVLTRTRRDGSLLSSHLLEEGIPVVSSETLLLSQSAVVQCLLNTLAWSLQPHREELQVRILNFLYDHLDIAEERHDFLQNNITGAPEAFSEKLKTQDIDFSFSEFGSLSLYEGYEYLLRAFKLTSKADGYVFGFMDLVFDFMSRPQAGKTLFLEHWETVKDSASVTTNNEVAVEVMTIHKAKGLEFPVVIFPYADMRIRSERNAKVWFPLEEPVEGFDEVLINSKKEIAEYSSAGARIHEEREHLMEMDTINLLYVALTRAVAHLYIFARNPGEIRDVRPNSYNDLFAQFLESRSMWNDDNRVFEFGTPMSYASLKAETGGDQRSPAYASSSPNVHNVVLVGERARTQDAEKIDAIKVGNYLHEAMSRVERQEHLHVVLESLKKSPVLYPESTKVLENMISAIVSNDQLKHLFESGSVVLNERDIVTQKGQLLRPDRLNVWPDNSVSIIDYKTGAPDRHHADQIEGYEAALTDMGYSVREKLLIYCREDDIVINKV